MSERNYSIVGISFNNNSETENFVIYEPENKKARRKAERWAKGRYGDTVKELWVNSSSANPRFARMLIERGKIIETD